MLIRTLAIGLLLMPAAFAQDRPHVATESPPAISVYAVADGEPGIPVIVVEDPERGVPVRMIERRADGGIPVHLEYRDLQAGRAGSESMRRVPVLVVSAEGKR